jgi:hypothetical protein
MVFFTKMYALYIEKEQNSGPKNDHAMRKYAGQSFWVRALVLILYKEDTPLLYKYEFATESYKSCLNGGL